MTSPAESPRVQRLAEGVRRLRIGGSPFSFGERTLMILGGILAPTGFVLVLLGWYGAAHTPYLYEQIPYLASGGFLGLGLVFLGAFFYFAHWMTEMVRESRAQASALLDAIAKLEEAVRQQTGPDRPAPFTNGSMSEHTAGAATAARSGAPAASGSVLVATNRGSMAHRPDCVVVAGKSSLRAVEPSDGLLACKLCDPYDN